MFIPEKYFLTCHKILPASKIPKPMFISSDPGFSNYKSLELTKNPTLENDGNKHEGNKKD